MTTDNTPLRERIEGLRKHAQDYDGPVDYAGMDGWNSAIRAILALLSAPAVAPEPQTLGAILGQLRAWWESHKPTEEDLQIVREMLAVRPEVQAEITALNGATSPSEVPNG